MLLNPLEVFTDIHLSLETPSFKAAPDVFNFLGMSMMCLFPSHRTLCSDFKVTGLGFGTEQLAIIMLGTNSWCIRHFIILDQ